MLPSFVKGCQEVQETCVVPTDCVRKSNDGIKRCIVLIYSSSKILISNLWKKHNEQDRWLLKLMPEFCNCCFWLCFHKWNLLAFQSKQDQSVSLANRGCCWFREHSTLVFENNFNPSSSVEGNLSVTDALLCSHVCICVCLFVLIK